MTLTRVILALILLFVLPLNATAQDEGETEIIGSVELPPELDRVLRDYEVSWIARDEKGLAALFTEDGFILRPGHPPVRGRDAIEKSYANSGGPLHLRALDYTVSDSIGYMIGAFSTREGAPDIGKFILTLRRESGAGSRWLISADMDNGNR